MRRVALGVVAAATVAFAGEARAQGMPVFDSSNFGQMLISVKTLANQLQQLQATYSAITGSRGLGSILYNPALWQYLPADWRRVYSSAMAGGYAGISGTLGAIAAAERNSGNVNDAQAKIVARSQTTVQTDKAVGLQAYAGAQARLNQIVGLMGQINRTTDPKAIQELQARIAVEQAAVQHETTKLQLVAMLQRAEEKLVEQQKNDLAQRILSASNKGMPACCSSKPASP